MKKIIIVSLFVLIAILLGWTVFSVFKKSDISQEPQAEPAPSAEIQPQVAEPAPDSLEALTADTLDEAVADIDELTE